MSSKLFSYGSETKRECVGYDPAIPLLDTYPRESKTCAHENLYMSVHSGVLHSGNNPNVYHIINR